MWIRILGFSTGLISGLPDTAHLHHSISKVACERIGRARVLDCDGKGIDFLERRNVVVLPCTAGVPRNGRRWAPTPTSVHIG